VNSLVHRDVNTVFVAFFLFGGLATVAWYFPRAGIACAAGLLVVAVANWDARFPFQVYLDNMLSEPPGLEKIIPPTAQVLWSDDLRLPWFILRRPSYLSRNQTAGLVFNRDTTMEYLAHSAEVEAFQSEIATCKEMNGMIATCTLDADVLRDTCAPAAGGPDFVITDYEVGGLPPDYHWLVPSPGKPLENWHVFSCASVTKRMQAEPVKPLKPKTVPVSHG